MKRAILLMALTGLLLVALCACGRAWTCSQCGKDFQGDAYYDYTQKQTLCEDCARTYWMPLPYKNYKIK